MGSCGTESSDYTSTGASMASAERGEFSLGVLVNSGVAGSGHHLPLFEWATVTCVVWVEVLPDSSVASTVIV